MNTFSVFFFLETPGRIIRKQFVYFNDQNVNSFTLPLLHHGVVHFGYPYTSIQTRENSRLIFRVFKQKGFATRIFVDFSYAIIR